jgi:hypothetical protein
MSAKTDKRTDKTPEVAITGSPEQKAQQAAMLGGHNLRLFTYLQPYDLRHADQAAALRAVFRSEFNRECPLRKHANAPVRYLFVVDEEPVLLAQDDVPAFVFGAAIAKLGWTAATKVLYDAGILS